MLSRHRPCAEEQTVVEVRLREPPPLEFVYSLTGSCQDQQPYEPERLVDLKHHFLIAMPNQAGTYFGNTITYICEHSEDGAMGLMINRPTSISVGELIEQSGLSGSPDLAGVPILEGGPVSNQQGFVLHSDDGNFPASMSLGHGLKLTTAREVLEAIAGNRGPYNYLVALGYAGWGPQQLEGELTENAWLTCPASIDILFDVPFDERIDKAAASLGIDIRLMSGQAGHA